MKILITESKDFNNAARESLEKLGDVEAALLSYTSLKSKIKDIDVLVVRLGIELDKEILTIADKLKYILTPTTGLDHIDLEIAANLGIEVISLRGETAFLESIPSTAEHTWGLLLALLRQTTVANQHVKEGKWNRELFKGNNVRGKNLGIIGYGRVGKMVGVYGRAFQCDVGVYDIQQPNSDDSIKVFNTVEEILNWSDIVTIHIPMNPKNLNYLNQDTLDNLKKGAVIINTSRGGIWDENYVSQLLEKGHLKGVATDVLSNELDINSIASNSLVRLLQKGENIIITPHIAGATYESMAMVEEFIAKKFVKIVKSNE